MTPYRLLQRPSFRILGKQTWISGPDNDQFGRFWEQIRAAGLLDRLSQVRQAAGLLAGPQTASSLLGVSRVEKDPSIREFYYMIAVEIPDQYNPGDLEIYDVPAGRATTDRLETVLVPACTWAVFECHGKPPASIVEAEMFAFMHWLPSSGYRHALAPEMEVYPADAREDYCEFWLPVAML